MFFCKHEYPKLDQYELKRQHGYLTQQCLKCYKIKRTYYPCYHIYEKPFATGKINRHGITIGSYHLLRCSMCGRVTQQNFEV